MSNLVIWTKPVYTEFINEALLDEDETAVIEAHVIKHWSRARMCIELNMSESKIDEIMYMLKLKYWNLTKYSTVLADAWIAEPLKLRGKN